MLPDPLTVKTIDITQPNVVTVLSTESFAVTDVSPGRSVRIQGSSPITGGPSKLTVSHTVSNENKPAKTDRILIRLDHTFVDQSGKELTGYVYAVFGLPRGMYDAANAQPYDRQTVGLLMGGQLMGVLGAHASNNTLGGSYLGRILNGEP
jgi:hypothetical protein